MFHVENFSFVVLANMPIWIPNNNIEETETHAEVTERETRTLKLV